MELDEVDPERWAALEAATAEYIATPAVQQQFVEAAAALIQVGSWGGWCRGWGLCVLPAGACMQRGRCGWLQIHLVCTG